MRLFSYGGLSMTERDQSPGEDAQGIRPQTSDASLLRRMRLGSEDAATQLYLRYAHRLYALARAKTSPDLARRVDAEELVQSIFGSFFRGVASGYYEVIEGEELWKLFVVIALNKIRAKANFHHATKRDVRQTVSGELDEDALTAPEGHDAAALAFLKLTVEEALERLPAQHRQIVLLRIENYDVAEIAEKSGRSKRTVERLLQEARKKLVHLLKED